MSQKLFSFLKLFLWIQLFLLIVRQTLDFLGIQWLMIFVNFISILVTISALFHHFLIHFLFQFFLIFYNFFVIFCYFESKENLLSFDSNSHSFVSVIVSTHVTLNESQLKACVRAVESVQSVLHSVISLTLLTLFGLYFRKLRKKQKQQNSKSKSIVR